MNRAQKYKIIPRDDDAADYCLHCTVVEAVSWALSSRFNWQTYREVMEFITRFADYIDEEGDV